MPVTVQCFQCNAILTLDEGFRGGVCRCSSCGTLLQVPRGDDMPAARKPRPATPPSPVSPITPVQNATSSKLDVGLSRGQFDSPPSPQIRRQDVGLSSGLAAGRVHPTTPIAAPPRPASKRHRKSTATAGEITDGMPTLPAAGLPISAVPPAPAARARRSGSRTLFWLGLLLALLILAVITSFVVYYIWFYESPIAPGLRGG